MKRTPEQLKFRLAYPPTVNTYWRYTHQGVKISAKGRAYRHTVAGQVGYRRVPLEGRLSITLRVHVPDRRKRDMDNVQKALLDALGKANVYGDDSQIDEIHVYRCDMRSGGWVDVEILELIDNRD